jgi:hypothetical protein
MATATATRDQLLDPGKLVLRQQVGFDLADAESAMSIKWGKDAA